MTASEGGWVVRQQGGGVCATPGRAGGTTMTARAQVAELILSHSPRQRFLFNDKLPLKLTVSCRTGLHSSSLLTGCWRPPTPLLSSYYNNLGSDPHDEIIWIVALIITGAVETMTMTTLTNNIKTAALSIHRVLFSLIDRCSCFVTVTVPIFTSSRPFLL